MIQTAGPAVLSEMRQVNGEEERLRRNGNRPLRIVQVGGRAQIDFAARYPQALSVKVKNGAYGHGDAEIGFEPGRDRRDAQQPPERAERLVHGAGEQPAVGQAGSALMLVGHLENPGHRRALADRHLHPQPGLMVLTAAVATVVVRRQLCPRRRSVGMDGGRLGIFTNEHAANLLAGHHPRHTRARRRLRRVAQLFGFVMVAGGFAVIMGGFMWLASRIRRRGLGGAVMGPIDEVYHPQAHRARFDQQVEAEAVAPTPSPDDRVI